MRTKRSGPAGRPAPISAALRSQGSAADPGGGGPVDGSPGGQGASGAIRLIAILGIGLIAAALLLPSGEAPVIVPADTLQPAGEVAAAGVDSDTDTDRVAGSTRPQATSPAASSSASVTGEDLDRADRDQANRARASAARAKAARQKSASARARAKRPAKTKDTAGAGSSTTRPAVAPTPTPAPSPSPPAAAPPTPHPAPKSRAPAKSKPRGGPSAEFGGL